MTVRELIELLKKFDHNSKVLVTTYSDTVFEDVGRLRLLPADGSVVIEPKMLESSSTNSGAH